MGYLFWFHENTMSNVFIIKRGCPLCKNNIAGNDTVLYFCNRCNLLFKKKHLERISNLF